MVFEQHATNQLNSGESSNTWHVRQKLFGRPESAMGSCSSAALQSLVVVAVGLGLCC